MPDMTSQAQPAPAGLASIRFLALVLTLATTVLAVIFFVLASASDPVLGFEFYVGAVNVFFALAGLRIWLLASKMSTGA